MRELKQLKYRRARYYFMVFLMLGDMLMAAVAFALAYGLRTWIPFPTVTQELGRVEDYLPMLLIHTAAVLLVFIFAKLYVTIPVSRVDEFYAIIVAITLGTFLGVAFTSLLLRDFTVGRDYSRTMLFYVWLLSIVLIMLGRLLNAWLRRILIRRGWGRRQVLVVGTGDIARMILQKILWSPELGYDVAGVVANTSVAPASLLGLPIVGSVGLLQKLITEYGAEEVIIALPEETSHQEILWLISECERGRVTIRVYPDLFQIMTGPVSIGELGGMPLLTVRDIAQQGWRRIAKRMMDLMGSLVGLLLFSPPMMLISILIKLESPGSVFYVQERMGLDSRPFPILKFRSMRQDAEQQGPGWTKPGDPRRTKIGTLLRKTNLDEVPQFINVLLGDMSLVGPRPERPVYVAQFRRSIPRYMDRHREKAGMAGWAQVNGFRGDTSIVERTKYDLWYIENWSLLLDMRILIRTVLQFFHSPNAY
ncbi:MAG: undecaprenyl-phosphate glucose phosphotransferase [Chloroflexota bacterium]|nr:undecaprenyl-phosphate glucose phosphotransferase [Chloroflexota bacterium]